MPTYSCFMDPFPSFAWYSLCLLHPHRRLGTWTTFPLPQAVNLPFSFTLTIPVSFSSWLPVSYSPSETILLHSQQSLQGTPYRVQVESMVSRGPWGPPPHPPNPPAIPSGMSHKKLLPVFNKACFHLNCQHCWCLSLTLFSLSNLLAADSLTSFVIMFKWHLRGASPSSYLNLTLPKV